MPAVFHKYVTAGVGIVLSCASLYLSIPRFISSLYAIYPNTAYNQNDENLPIKVLMKCDNDLSNAFNWQKSGDYLKMQGVFKLKTTALISPTLQVFREPILLDAKKYLIEGLTISPVDPIAWYQLAYTESLLNQSIDQVINELRLSYYAGRVEPVYTMDRIKLSFLYYSNLPDDMKITLNQQINLAWQYDPKELIKYCVNNPEFNKIADTEISRSSDESIKFRNQIEKYIKKHSNKQK